MADIYLADALSPSPTNPIAPQRTVSLTAQQLSSKVGLYRDLSNNSLGRVFIRSGRLMASTGVGEDNSVELTPVSENKFIIAGTAVVAEFVPATVGGAQEIHVTGGGPKPAVSQQVPAFTPSNTELRTFVGQYASPELAVTYTLAARDSGLVIEIPGRTDISLQAVLPDAFAGPVVGIATFSRDARGVVTGFTVKAADVRSLRFDRVKYGRRFSHRLRAPRPTFTTGCEGDRNLRRRSLRWPSRSKFN